MSITNRKSHHLIVIILLFLFFFQAFLGIYYKSPSFDEVGHLARGYLYLKTGDMMIITHPPLVHIISAFPLLFININMPDNYKEFIIKNDPIELGQEIFYHANNNANIVFFWSRFPLILLGILLGIYIYKWSKELYGIKAGIISLVLYSFNPIILGNAPLIMTDMAVTSFGFISLYYLWKFLSNKSVISLILTAVAFGIAQLSKFTALFLIPVFVLLMLFSSYEFSLKILLKEAIKKKLLKKFVFLSVSFGIIILLAWLIINIFYGFEDFLKPIDARISEDDGGYFNKEDFKSDAIAGRITTNPFLHSIISKMLNYAPSILPYSYLKDLVAVIRFSNIPILKGGYLMGEYSEQGWWYYYLFAFLIKTPIPLLVLLISLAIFLYQKTDFKNEIFLMLPIVVFLVYFSFHRTIGGVRYILPIFPFLFVFVGKLLNEKAFGVKIARIKKVVGHLIILLLILYVAESIFTFPNYIAYFNQIIGGASNGYKYLQGNDLDVGQDLPQLRDYIRKNEITNLKLAYYGTSNPYYYLNFTCVACPVCPSWILSKCHENCKPLQGIIAVSASLLQNTPHLNNRTCFDWIRAYEPIDKIGYTIFIYNTTKQEK